MSRIHKTQTGKLWVIFTELEARDRLASPPDPTTAMVSRYIAKHVDPSTWLVIEDFVRTQAARLGDVGESAIYRYLRSIAYISAWHVESGRRLDVNRVFAPENVDSFINSTQDRFRPSARGTYRSELARIGAALTHGAGWRAPTERIKGSRIAAPYTEAEVEALRRDVFVQSTPNRIRVGRALIALGLGAGLDGRWLTKIRGTDVQVRQARVVIDVPEPAPRLVVVRSSFGDEFQELAAQAGTELLVGLKSHNGKAPSRLLKSLNIANGTIRVRAGRLRSTWLKDQIVAGTRIDTIMRAAGIASSGFLEDLLPHLAPEDPEAQAISLGAA